MDKLQLQSEIIYRTARSGGSGGQHVNKVETKAEAILDIAASQALLEPEKALILQKLSHKINKEGQLSVTNQTERSQLANKEKARQKLQTLIEQALIVPKKRKKVVIPVSVIEKRKKDKKLLSEKKMNRRKFF